MNSERTSLADRSPSCHAPCSWIAFALLALLIALSYGNSLGNEFANDDLVIIVKNRLITRLDNIPRLFTQDYWASRRDPREAIPPPGSGLYRPFVLATYALNYAVGALNPIGYHLVNLLLHLLVTWLVYRLALQLGVSPSAATAAAVIFAVHPLHTEAVTGIVGRAELLMAACVLGGLLLAATGRLWASLGAFAVGLFSKEQAAVFPVLLVLYDLCLGHAPGAALDRPAGGARLKTVLSRYGGYLVLLAGYLLFRATVLGGLRPPPLGFLENPPIFADWMTRWLTLVKVDGRYLWLSIWPSALSPDYSYNAIPLARSLFEPGVLWGGLAWGGLLALAIWSFRKGLRRACFAVGFTLMTFAPVSNLLVPIGTLMGERLFYLPSAGLCLLLGIGWEGLMARFAARPARLAAHILLGLLCLGLTVRTVIRNQDWVTTETLFRRAAEVVPGNAKVHVFIGKSLMDRGERAEALQEYETALRLYPDYAGTDPSFNAGYGDLLLHAGRIEEGLRALERAVSLDPQWSSLHYNLGLAYARQERYEQAEQEWRQALALYPDAPHIRSSLSRLLIERGRFAEALTEAESALQQDPEFVLAIGNRAWALEGLGRLEEAAAGYERVLAKNPSFEDLRARLQRLRARLGH